MFRFLETIKIKYGKPQNLEYHQQRLNKAMKDYYNLDFGFSLGELISVPEEFSCGISKCRFIYNDKSFDIKFSKYNFKEISSLKIVKADNIEYNFKYSNRSVLNSLFEQRGDCDDILIVKSGLITDVSIANICFYDGINWYTPSRPLLEGTCRKRLLEKGIIQPRDIKVSDIDKYVYFTIINAMRGDELSDLKPIDNIVK